MLKKQPNFRTDIAVLRFICITVVVFFHGYGMTYVHFSDDVNAAYSGKSPLARMAVPI